MQRLTGGPPPQGGTGRVPTPQPLGHHPGGPSPGMGCRLRAPRLLPSPHWVFLSFSSLFSPPSLLSPACPHPPSREGHRRRWSLLPSLSPRTRCPAPGAPSFIPGPLEHPHLLPRPAPPLLPLPPFDHCPVPCPHPVLSPHVPFLSSQGARFPLPSPLCLPPHFFHPPPGRTHPGGRASGSTGHTPAAASPPQASGPPRPSWAAAVPHVPGTLASRGGPGSGATQRPPAVGQPLATHLC